MRLSKIAIQTLKRAIEMEHAGGFSAADKREWRRCEKAVRGWAAQGSGMGGSIDRGPANLSLRSRHAALALDDPEYFNFAAAVLRGVKP